MNALHDPRLVDLMRQVAAGASTVVIRDSAAHPQKSAAVLVHIAECYGYRYSHLRVERRFIEHTVVLVLDRDPSPDGRRRAAATMATLPPAFGGMFPGMRPGRLPDRPEAEGQLDLIRAHVRFETLTRLPARRAHLVGWVSSAVVLLPAVLTGEYLFLGAMALLVLLPVYGGIAYNRLHRRVLSRRLTAAGCVPVLAEDGRPGFSRSVPSGFGVEGRLTAMTSITDWAAFSLAEPELAEVVEKRFGDFTHHVLATLRSDGSPRTTGIEVRFLDGDLWLGMMPGSLKARDLLRDPRFNLQANPGPGVGMGGGDVRVAGRAVPVEDGEARSRYVGEVSPPDPDAFHLFRVDLTEVVRVSVENDEYMVVQTWKPGEPLRSVRRT